MSLVNFIQAKSNSDGTKKRKIINGRKRQKYDLVRYGYDKKIQSFDFFI